MVKLFRILLSSARKKPRSHFRPNFIDSIRLTVKAGHGGNGLPQYGGQGGQGGNVYLIAKDKITMKKVVQAYREKRVLAGHGEHSSKTAILGRRGTDEQIQVPVGVQVFDSNGKLIGDLNEPNSTCVVATGGIGGCPSTKFIGEAGVSQTITLDLKLIADVGLVGFPNAGKSTLLKAISNASPKIASYPFTTIRPQLGVIEYPDLRSISVADLPGLIEGAHANIGMGHKFLKHIERTRLLLMVVDIFGFRLSQMRVKRSCLENIIILNKELELYDKNLLDKPCILLINKMDLDGAKDELRKLESSLYDLHNVVEKCPEEIRPDRLLNFSRIIPISAKNQHKINIVIEEIRNVLDEYAEKKLEDITEKQDRLKMKITERGPRLT